MSKYIHRLLAFRDRHDATYFFNSILIFAKRYAKVVGLDLFAEGYSPKNFVYIWSVTWVIVFILNNFYTMYLRIEDGFVKILICASTLGMAFQGLPKVYLFAVNHRVFKEKCIITLDMYSGFKRAEIKVVARNFAFGCYLLYNWILHIAYMFAAVGAFTIPMAGNYYLTGGTDLPFDIKLPLIGQSGVGFYIHLAYLGISALMEVVGLLCGDCFYSMLLLNAFTQLENIFIELTVLNQNIETLSHDHEQNHEPNHDQENDGLTSQSKKVGNQLRHVIELHQAYIEYISFVIEKFGMYFSANIATMVMQVVFSLYIVFYERFWIIGYIMIFTATVQLLFTCALGTFLDVKHDELLFNITQICWYEMDIQDQKEYQFMLAAAQRYHYLEYIFGQLDVQTFVEIYKKIYSAFTMLVNTAT